jgi:ferritin-like protein
MASEGYHEASDLLSERTRNMHRAIVSLKEELEAIDWYQQRAEACSDQQLKDVLLHNKNEEIEHAMMLLEWIRRHDDDFAERMKTYLFTEAPITGIEKAAEGAADGGAAGAAPAGTLGIGALRGR